MSTAPYNKAFYDAQSQRSLSSARVALEIIFRYIRPRSVLDVGCGVGTWLRAAADLGVEVVTGIDGEYVDQNMLLIDPNHFIAADLKSMRLEDVIPVDGKQSFDMVICLEVAEHLPFERSTTFVADLAKKSDLILFSAAVPFQYGTDHVNEQWAEFWAILFRAHGFSCYDWVRDEIYSDPNVDWWYAQNILIYTRDGSAAAALMPPEARVVDKGISRVHPENFLVNLLTLHRKYGLDAFSEELDDFKTVRDAFVNGAGSVPSLRSIVRAAVTSGENVFPNTRTLISHPQDDVMRLERLLEAEVAKRHLVERDLKSEQNLSAKLSARVDLLEEREWRRHGKHISFVRAIGKLVARYNKKRVYNNGHLVSLSKNNVYAAADRLAALPVFDPRDYRHLNPDAKAARRAPHVHALCHGAFDGRALFRRERIAKVLGAQVLIPATNGASQLISTVSRDVVGIYTSSHGNVFMHEIAQGLKIALESCGMQVQMNDEFSDVSARPAYCVFVAPHEFFILGEGRRWIRDDVLNTSFMFNTEQVQTVWFNKALPFLLLSRGVIDIVAQTAQIVTEAGVPAIHFEPSAVPTNNWLEPVDELHPMFRVLPANAWRPPVHDDDWVTRPIDVSFFGAESPHRENFFSKNAARFSEYSTYIYYRRASAPIKKGTQESALTRLAGHISGHSKIALNVHREEFGYFEWHRIVRLGMCSGAVVVSEPCLPNPVFKAGVHYLEENLRQIPNMIDWLLRSTDGINKAKEIRSLALQTVLDVAKFSDVRGSGLFNFLKENYHHAA